MKEKVAKRITELEAELLLEEKRAFEHGDWNEATKISRVIKELRQLYWSS